MLNEASLSPYTREGSDLPFLWPLSKHPTSLNQSFVLGLLETIVFHSGFSVVTSAHFSQL